MPRRAYRLPPTPANPSDTLAYAPVFCNPACAGGRPWEPGLYPPSTAQGHVTTPAPKRGAASDHTPGTAVRDGETLYCVYAPRSVR
jgi:hypothetical protein